MPFNTLGHFTVKMRYPKKLICISFTLRDTAMGVYDHDPLARVVNDPSRFSAINSETKTLGKNKNCSITKNHMADTVWL